MDLNTTLAGIKPVIEECLGERLTGSIQIEVNFSQEAITMVNILKQQRTDQISGISHFHVTKRAINNLNTS